MKYFAEIMKVIGSITIDIGTKTLKLQDVKTEEELYQLTSRITRFLPYEGKTAVELGVCPLPTKCPEVATCMKEVCNMGENGYTNRG